MALALDHRVAQSLAMAKSLGHGPMISAAFWSEWRAALQSPEDELDATFELLEPPRVMSRSDKLRQAEAVVEAALAFSLKNYWERTLSQREVARSQLEFPPVLNLSVSDLLRFIERSFAFGDFVEPLLEEFDQPAWRRLWSKEERFHEDCLN